MRFWDTSAIVPLIVQETTTTQMLHLLSEDPELAVSTLTTVEIMSALARRNREVPDDAALKESRALLGELSAHWREVAPDRKITDIASELLFRHALKAADAVQLATAIAIGTDLPFVTLDRSLAVAATAEGFRVQP